MKSNTNNEKIAGAMAYASGIDKNTRLDRLDIMKAYLEGAAANDATAVCGQQPDDSIPPVSIRYDEQGNPDGIRVQTLDEAFILALHDEGEMDYEKAKAYELPTAKQARIYGAYLDEINEALDEAGGDRLEEDFYWTKTPSAGNVGRQLIFYGPYGSLGSNKRCISLRVRVSLALNTANS